MYVYLSSFLAGLSMAQVPTSGLVARYEFNYSGSQTYNFYKDATSNGYDLCELDVNNAVGISPGLLSVPADHCGYYNGLSGLKTCNPGNHFDTSGSISISAWIKITGFQQWNTIAVFRISDTQSPYNTINLCTGTYLYNRLGVSYSTINQTDQMLAGTTVLSSNQWYHVACTFNKITGEVKLYLNGNLEANTYASPNSGLHFPGGSFYKIFSIGNIPSGVGYNGFKGFIDQVLVYTRALTSTEVLDIYNNMATLLGISSNKISIINNLYPIPASNLLNIECEQAVRADIVNVLGEKIISCQLSEGKNEIHINHLNQGIYFIHTQTGEVLKFIKD